MRRAAKLAGSIRTRSAHLHTGPRQVKRRNREAECTTEPDRFAPNPSEETACILGGRPCTHICVGWPRREAATYNFTSVEPNHEIGGYSTTPRSEDLFADRRGRYYAPGRRMRRRHFPSRGLCILLFPHPRRTLVPPSAFTHKKRDRPPSRGSLNRTGEGGSPFFRFATCAPEGV